MTIAQANLTDPIKAPAEIDRVLRQCYVDSRPVYIELPSDIALKPVDGSSLAEPLDLSTPKSNAGAEERAVYWILDKLYAATKPIILVDAGAHRHRVCEEVTDFWQERIVT